MTILKHYIEIWKINKNYYTSIGKDKIIEMLLDELKRLEYYKDKK